MGEQRPLLISAEAGWSAFKRGLKGGCYPTEQGVPLPTVGRRKEKTSKQAREVGMSALKERKERNSSKKSVSGIFECLFLCLFQNIPPGMDILVYLLFFIRQIYMVVQHTHR